VADFSAVGFPAEPHHRQRAERQGATRKQLYRKGGGGKITRLTLFPKLGIQFPPKWANPWLPVFDRKRGRRYIAENIQMTLAGALAETLHTRCWQQAPGLEDDDESLALDTGRPLHRTPKATREWVNRLRFQMLETLRAPDVWDAVDVVARELLKKSTLRGSEVRALFNRALPS
jgi:hypothetical protein